MPGALVQVFDRLDLDTLSSKSPLQSHFHLCPHTLAPPPSLHPAFLLSAHGAWGNLKQHQMGPLVTTAGSHQFVATQPLLCPVHLIHIDGEKLGMTCRISLNSCRPQTAVRHYIHYISLAPNNKWAKSPVFWATMAFIGDDKLGPLKHSLVWPVIQFVTGLNTFSCGQWRYVTYLRGYFTWIRSNCTSASFSVWRFCFY